MLSLKQQAALEVAKTLVLAIVIGTGTGILINSVPLAILGIGVCAIVIVYALKIVYEMKLSELEAKEKLKN